MNTTAVFFTMWIGSFNYCGMDIGLATLSVKECAGVPSVRPTIDAEYEVVADDDAADQ
jgi:hypothetical protein